MTRLARGWLIIGSLVFLAVGAVYLIMPVEWAAVVEIQVPTAMARTDLRATYGGLNVAIGVYLALCASRTGWLRPGITAFGLAAAGFAAGRLIGILAEGAASSLMWVFLAIELATVAIALVLLRRLPSSEPVVVKPDV